MVTGIGSFKEWFKGNEEQYAIIDGTACDSAFGGCCVNSAAYR